MDDLVMMFGYKRAYKNTLNDFLEIVFDILAQTEKSQMIVF
jgi:hypothetical protein